MTQHRTLFIRLPHTLRKPISGGCNCPYCMTHPNQAPKWDTLAVDEKGNSWTVHHPEPIQADDTRS